MQIIYNPVPWVSIQTGRGGGQLVDTDWLPARMAEPVIAFEFGLKYFELQLKFRVPPDSGPLGTGVSWTNCSEWSAGHRRQLGGAAPIGGTIDC